MSTTSYPSEMKFHIPEGLVPIPDSELDHRSDNEILSLLNTYSSPTSSEKNVWAYWHTGLDSMPPWTQRNVVDWVRRLGPSWTVRVLDRVPGSPMNVSRFVDAKFFPDAFNAGRMTGPYVATHSADLARLPLLQLYGGVWMDVGIILIRHLDDIWNVIEDPSNSFEFAAMTFECRPGEELVINPFFVSKKDNALVKRWHEIYLAVWGSSTESTGFHKHPLLRHIPLYGTPTEKMNCHEITVPQEAIMDYGTHVLCFERLRDLVDPSDGFDGRAYYEEKMFLLPALKEMWYYQERTAFSGKKQFELLRTRYDGPDAEQDERFRHAKAFVDDMLANTTMLKFCHGPKGVMESSLADIWDDPKNYSSDSEPGTFAAYLRHGCISFNQTQSLKPLKVQPPATEVWNVGLLDPFMITNDTPLTKRRE